MLNWIWLGLIVIGVLLGGLFGRLGGEDGVVDSAFSMARTAVFGIVLPLMGFWMMWLGIMRLAEKAGMINAVARFLRPLLRRLFPDVPSDHPAMGAIVMNMAANILGLGNSATPFGLKAMEHLDELNPNKGTATNAMCTFLAINTSSVTLIPATAIGFLSSAGITNPYAIVGPAILATLCSTIVAIIAVKTFEKLPVFAISQAPVPPEKNPEAPAEGDAEVRESDPANRKLSPFGTAVIIGTLVALLGIAVFETFPEKRIAFLESAGLAELFVEEETPEASSAPAVKLDDEESIAAMPLWRRTINTISVMAIPFVLVIFTLLAALKRIPVYEEFVEGAKEGFNVAVRVMPYLVAMLVALGVFRASGALELLQRMLSPLLKPLGFSPELLPMALIRPLSGGGSTGVLGEILTNNALSDAIKYTAATMFGSTETTFYVLAVYFGSVGIRKSRHALAAGLCADLAGMIAAVLICRAMFGA